MQYEDLVNLEELHPISCKVIKVSMYVCMDVAIWLVVFFTLERFMAVCLPFYFRDTPYCQVLLCSNQPEVLDELTSDVAYILHETEIFPSVQT